MKNYEIRVVKNGYILMPGITELSRGIMRETSEVFVFNRKKDLCDHIIENFPTVNIPELEKEINKIL